MDTKKRDKITGTEYNHWHQSEGHILRLVCVVAPRVHTEDSGNFCSDVREAWQRLNSVALHHVSWGMRGCRAWPGVKGQNCTLSERRSNYRRLNPLTHRHVMKGSADSFETPRRGYLFVNVRLLKLEQREDEEGRDSVRIIFARESPEELWKQHVSPSASCWQQKYCCATKTLPWTATKINCFNMFSLHWISWAPSVLWTCSISNLCKFSWRHLDA